MYTKKIFALQTRKAIVDKLILESDVFANSKDNIIEHYSHPNHKRGKIMSFVYSNDTTNISERYLDQMYQDFINITKKEDFNPNHEIIKVVVRDIDFRLSCYKDICFFKLPLDLPFNSVTTDEICAYPIRVTTVCPLRNHSILSVDIGIIEGVKQNEI